MQRVTIAEIYQKTSDFNEKTITVAGWVRTARTFSAVGFIELNDGSCFGSLQVVLEKDSLADFDRVAACHVGAALCVTGVLKCTPQARQPFELQAVSVSVEGASTPDYPLQKKRHSVEFLRSVGHLRARTNLFGAAFRIRSEAAFAIHSFFHDRGFYYVHTPIITVSDCEGAGEMFRVTTLDPTSENAPYADFSADFFEKPAFLTVSGQLEGEMMAQCLGRIYTFGPTFRAEKSYTQRHAAEFWMIEPEMAFADLADDRALAEDLVRFVVRHCLTVCEADLAFLDKRVSPGLLERLRACESTSFAHMSYTQAIDELKKNNANFQYPAFWGCDLQTEHERYLSETVCRRPVFVTDYPKEIKAFYMRLNDDEKTVAAMDCLVPGIGELIGGSQREERLPYLLRRMEECSLSQQEYSRYLDLRRYGSTRHAGFGLGFERLIMYLTGIANIRDVLPFPRTTGSAD